MLQKGATGIEEEEEEEDTGFDCVYFSLTAIITRRTRHTSWESDLTLVLV
jgi:uncharacterized membrane protein